MLPATNLSLSGRCALRFYRAGSAVGVPVTVQRLAIIDVRVAPDQHFLGGADVHIFVRVVNKLVIVEAAIEFGARAQRLRHISANSGLVTGKDFPAFEVPSVSHHRQRFEFHRLTGLQRHRAELITVVTHIGHFVRDNQMMLGIDRRLHVVTHDSITARDHGACVRIGLRDLFVRRCFKLFFNRLKLLHLRFQLGDFLLQPAAFRPRGHGLFPISRIQRL
ncbi:hypothetical protein D3C80_336310 [compost metagenome]